MKAVRGAHVGFGNSPQKPPTTRFLFPTARTAFCYYYYYYCNYKLHTTTGLISGTRVVVVCNKDLYLQIVCKRYCMTRKQPTPIDEDEYDRFVQFVEDIHGGTRGHLRTEIENALREYRESYYTDNDQIGRIQDDVATIKAMLAEAEADGGTDIPDVESARARTAADDDAPLEKPAANQPRSAKVDWLVQEVRDRADRQVFSLPAIRKVVDDAYGFNDDTVDDYVDRILDDLDAVADPTDPNGRRICWGNAIDRKEAEVNDAAADEAAAELDAITSAGRADD